jgi:hypothetical protein
MARALTLELWMNHVVDSRVGWDVPDRPSPHLNHSARLNRYWNLLFVGVSQSHSILPQPISKGRFGNGAFYHRRSYIIEYKA